MQETMNKAMIATVRDKHGNTVERGEGEFQDGDVILTGGVRRAFAMADSSARTQDSAGRILINDTPHRGGVHTVAMRVLGDAYSVADYAGLSDEAIRHAVVKRKLGFAAEGRSASFLDAAWQTFSGGSGEATTSASPAAGHGMTDAQRALAARGVEAALADAASRGRPMVNGVRQFQAQDRAVASSAYAEMRTRMSDAWKSPEQRARDAGARADAAANPLKDQRMAALEARDAEYRARYRGCWGR